MAAVVMEDMAAMEAMAVMVDMAAMVVAEVVEEEAVAAGSAEYVQPKGLSLQVE